MSSKEDEGKGGEAEAKGPDEGEAARVVRKRGRRKTVCAMPVTVEDGWMPPVVAKSDDAKKRIRETISQNILFSGLEPSERDIVVDAMEEKEFAADDVLIRQGDVGDFFYVLESGHCDISVEGVGKVMDCGPGTSFGELALMYDAPRAATVVATEPTVTWAVDQLTFKKTIMDATIKRRARHEAFISAVPILSSLNSYERLIIADALTRVEFADDVDVIKEGEEGARANTFYIIESGEVRCTKAGVSQEVSRRLRTGDYFGERALLTGERRAATVCTVEPTVCQTLDRATFQRLLGPLSDIMRSNMAVYEKYKDSVPDPETEAAEAAAATAGDSDEE